MVRLPRNRAVRFFWLCCTLCAGFHFHGTTEAQSILLHLRNGDRLSGSLIAEEAASLTISNSILGKVAVPLAQIEKRESLTNAAVAVQAITTITNVVVASPALALPPVAEKRLVELQTAYVTGQISSEEYHRQRSKMITETAVAASNAVPVAVQAGKPVPAAAAIMKPSSAPAKPARPKVWSGDVSIGLDMAFSEKSRDLYSGRLKLSYTKAPVRNHLDYLFTYGRTDGELSANRMDGLMKSDIDLNPQMYLYSLGAAGYDEIRKIDWRYEVGPGMGYYLIKRSNFVARVEGGFHYQVQNFEGNRQDEEYYHRLAQDSRWNIGTQFTFDQKVEYLPQLTDFHVYKLRVEANVRYWLRSNLSLNFTVIDTYDTVTAEGVGQNDLQLRSSIGVKF